MFGISRAIKCCAAALVAATMVFAAASPSKAETGTVRMTVTKAGFIVGAGGGNGVLRFRGHSYPLSIGGVSVGMIGIASADLVGRAYHLRSAGDIVGTYTAVSAGIAVAGGGKVARLQNSNGVVLELQGRQIGAELSLSLSGMTVSMR